MKNQQTTKENSFLSFLVAVFAFVFVLPPTTLLFGCNANKNNTTLQLSNCDIQHEQEFGGVDIKTANLANLAREYLLENGMTQAQINALTLRICNVS